MATSGQVMKDKGVKILLDKERTLKFDLNALCILQDEFENLDEAFKGLGKKDFKVIRKLIYAVLAHEEDDSFNEKKAGSLVTIQNITEVAEALAEALSDSMPDDEGTEEGKK